MRRLKLFVICLVCALVAPFLVVAMLCQALAGSQTRAQSMANAFDECGNSLLGGDESETISRRTGLAVIAGKRWGKTAAPLIDFFFGEGHCAEKALPRLPQAEPKS